MNNYRGFSQAIVPILQVNFLVGENSTGKSSFLNLINLFSNSQYWFFPDKSLQDVPELGGFHDIVSAWSEDKSTFQIGIINTKIKSDKTELDFCIHTFGEKDGSPRLERYTELQDGKLTAIIFEKITTKYQIIDMETSFSSEASALNKFKKLISIEKTGARLFKSFPKGYPADMPIVIARSTLENIEKLKAAKKSITEMNKFEEHVIRFAPIRSKPLRFYDGVKKGYSPEGEHTPLLLRKTLRSRVSSKKFAKFFADFGNESGLFETITPHTFGKGSQSPFELLVNFSGASLNINNVGYGVSQVLPLVVEFLSAEKMKTFVVQQPEVHLHPKAQATLGGLIFELAKVKHHSFYIETHSDYLIDRYRLSMRRNDSPPHSQTIFFKRTNRGNEAIVLPIKNDGLYPTDQPKEFRDFFIKEEMKLLDL